MRSIRTSLLAFAILLSSSVAFPATGQTEGDYLYNVMMLRAAPGHFNDLIQTLERAEELAVAAGDEAGFWLRHSQGDHWDFMLILPMDSYAQFYSSARTAQRESVWGGAEGQDVIGDLEAYTSYQEEWFAESVDLDEMRRRFDGMGLYHVEMFAGLPGKREDLLEQRRMENRYYEHLDRQLNLLFVRAGGPNWDAMTIGFYPSLQDYAAAGVRYTEEEQDAAARVAGFDGVGDLSRFLRSLLSYHHDTLAVPLR